MEVEPVEEVEFEEIEYEEFGDFLAIPESPVLLFADHNAVFGLTDDRVDVIYDGASDLLIVVCEERHFEESGAVESEFLFLDLAILFE